MCCMKPPLSPGCAACTHTPRVRCSFVSRTGPQRGSSPKEQLGGDEAPRYPKCTFAGVWICALRSALWNNSSLEAFSNLSLVSWEQQTDLNHSLHTTGREYIVISCSTKSLHETFLAFLFVVPRVHRRCTEAKQKGMLVNNSVTSSAYLINMLYNHPLPVLTMPFGYLINWKINKRLRKHHGALL